MDPYYRTIKGFCVLIEKEWVSYGHMFAWRGRLHFEELSENNYSQVFIQWLDCVYQYVIQYPEHFEFRIDLLDFIADHVYSCRYGTFIFNNERDRELAKAKQLTVSIWTDILEESKFKSFSNPYYNKNKDLENLDFLLPDPSLYKLSIWDQYYLKYSNQQNISLGKFTIQRGKDNSKVKKINNVMEFYYEDKENINEEIKMKEEEVMELELALKEILDKNLLSPEELKSIDGIDKILPNIHN